MNLMNDTWFIVLLGIIIYFILLIWWLWKKSQVALGYQSKFPKSFYCQDGDKVKSLSECLIDDCLFRNGIQHTYEDFIDKNDANYKYDWYLAEADIYLEFFGFFGKKYHDTRMLKEKFYKTRHLTMIAIEPSDTDKIEEKLSQKLGANTWEKLKHPKHCPNCGQILDNRI
jgi:hypothetical protein